MDRTLAPALALLLLLCGPAALAAQRSYDPFDEQLFLLPSDADTLGLEDSVVPQAEADVRRAPLRLSPMAMLMLNAPMGADAPVLGGMVQVDMVLRRNNFGAQLTPRLRLENVAHLLGKSSTMVQQAFAFFRAGGGEIKVGKVLAQFGRMWDYGVYGPLLGNNDLKITPDLGVSFELTQPLAQRLELEVAGQYFAVDGRTFSVHNPTFFSAGRARRRHIAGVRAVPVLHVGDNKFSLGLSGQHYSTARPTPHQVWRGAVDFNVEHPWFNAFVEVGRQAGEDITAADNPISSYNYLWSGVEAKLSALSLRYHINVVRYEAPYPGIDVLHQPGAQWSFNDAVSLVVEGAVWRTNQNVLARGEVTLLAAAFFKL